MSGFVRGQVLLVTAVAEGTPTQVVRVLEVESMPDGDRVLLERLTGEEPTDG